nr:UPF0764 protein C16orf89-like [Biomphalaria glabrata]
MSVTGLWKGDGDKTLGLMSVTGLWKGDGDKTLGLMSVTGLWKGDGDKTLGLMSVAGLWKGDGDKTLGLMSVAGLWKGDGDKTLGLMSVAGLWKGDGDKTLGLMSVAGLWKGDGDKTLGLMSVAGLWKGDGDKTLGLMSVAGLWKGDGDKTLGLMRALLQAKQDCESGKLDCPVDLVYTLNKYVTSMDDYGNKALAYIEAEDSSYFEQFLDTINSPYTFDVKLDSLGDTSGVTPGTDGSYDEVRGDRCLSLILGSYEKNKGKYPKCSVDQECWTMMTKGNTMAYVITHQLLYFVMVEKSGCVAPIEELVYKYNKTSLRDFEKRLCKSIYVEAQQEEVGNSVKELKQDLFLEQLLLCSLVGFQEFFQEKWIRLVLSWQKPRGCYGMPASLMKVEAELTRVQEDEKHLLQLLTEEAEKIDSNPHGRKLLREKIMTSDCLSHKTGLAFGNLGLQLRYLINALFTS